MARILIAEDDDSMRLFLARALQRAGHDVMSVGNGADALALMQDQSFELLLADIVMPEMDGIELAQRAASADSALRVIFITGFAAVAVNRNAGGHSSAKILSKPFHLRELVEEIDKALAARASTGFAPA